MPFCLEQQFFFSPIDFRRLKYEEALWRLLIIQCYTYEKCLLRQNTSLHRTRIPQFSEQSNRDRTLLEIISNHCISVLHPRPPPSQDRHMGGITFLHSVAQFETIAASDDVFAMNINVIFLCPTGARKS